MTIIIVSNITTCLVTALIVTLFFIFKIWRKWSEVLDEDFRKRNVELGHVVNELSPGESEGEPHVKE